MRIHVKIKNLKDRYLIHKKQQKFQVSFLDWTPYFDWYVVIGTFFVLLAAIGSFSYLTYKQVNVTMNDFESIEITDKTIDIEGYREIRRESDERSEVLNSLR